ncbi:MULTISPECIES: tRNA (adenosine(37)-N6)-threonylcarbamoyltransferase complex transferase subunit TsaD [unclassified Corynebacterium]|uniref:tRNA (adenosine(37)-N6)-threonylcarbamoyltransferase complex transferase subunit TsaD n=1 Tax=unclassified Corynebacterium TaxID=2624378 RepID=UPI001EF50ADA|nr:MULTISPECIES: tRNA (adenosine(37)-N6)-threonylcarbamoyltransferase complex transferase subunit TsaD [unclassified Corynebacterium]MCG7258504.1 tRNA (adenosine(37)-N6)-threonylcarbamoyltransferase complex transferase subunit TsaD [Corynebacterium sp. ACRQK]MCG7263049.1 tRNA (adenosine(37)-N6)-threonylcarbamoyltransferase complex transferase subunit TsaD [Corynebacterium sp. ACRQL]
MIYALAVDTSTNYVTCGIAQIAANGQVSVLAERLVDNVRGHMELLTPNIQACLAEAELSPRDLHAVVAGTGPGPFTGLRVGMATAAAFGDALSIPVHGIPSAAATAWEHATSQVGSKAFGDYLIVSDARRREFYHSRMSFFPGLAGRLCSEVQVPASVHAPDVVRDIQSEFDRWPLRVLSASAVAEQAEELFGSQEGCQIESVDAHPTPRGLVLAALEFLGSVPGLLADAPALRALYLRRPDAKEPKAKAISKALDFSRVQEVGVQAEVAGSEGDAAGGDPHTGSRSARVRLLTTADAPACAEIEQILFPEDSPWSAEAFASEIFAPHTHCLALETTDPAREPQLIGYAILAVGGPANDPEAEIHTIGILPEWQGKGLSKLLMDPLVTVADRLRAPIFLEVRTDNRPAVGLYERYGFAIEGTRRAYYQPSGADAFTMVRPAFLSDATPAPDSGTSNRPSYIMGIESSCDETGVGIVASTVSADGDAAAVGEAAAQLEIVANKVASSMEQHARFGGVVPEIASRAHLEAMQPTMRAALAEARENAPGFRTPDVVAATVGPGLAGALLVGAAAAKAYALAWQVPFYGVNHLGGHVAVGTLDEGADEGVAGSATKEAGADSDLGNAIALLVSGGHTQILHVTGVGAPMEELGSTLDDAAGEAYDKVARLLGLGYPGGPVIDRLAAQGNPQAIAFPRGMMRQQDSRYDFSFSGLKTAVARYVEQAEKDGARLPIEDVCASFQEAVVDVLITKALRACEDKGAGVMLLGGGVSANRRLREVAAERCGEVGVELKIPQAKLCTDNGVMMAALAARLVAAGEEPSGLATPTDPSLDVEEPVLRNC